MSLYTYSVYIFSFPCAYFENQSQKITKKDATNQLTNYILGNKIFALLPRILSFPPSNTFPIFSVKGFFSIFWEFFLIRCEVKGQGCLYVYSVQIVKPSGANS